MNQFFRFIERYKLLHIGYWIWAFTGLYHERQEHQEHSILSPLHTSLVMLSGEMLSVYVTLYIIIPRTFRKNKYALFACLSLLTCLAAAIAATGFESLYLFITTGRALKHFAMWSLIDLVDNFIATAVFVAVSTVASRFYDDQRNKQIERQRLETELSFLKAQINPHFLFNVINSIYVLIGIDPRQASSTLLQFSDLLRYQLYECKDNYVPISRELKFLQDYISMESVRRGDKVKVVTTFPEEIHSFSIAPFLLIPFVENAFKFVTTYKDRDNYIRIEAALNPNDFSFSVVNTIDETPVQNRPNSGIGLQNVRRRLELLYPGRHELRISSGNGVYTINLLLHANTDELHHHGR